MIGVYLGMGVGNAMKRSVYYRSGKRFRVPSRQLVREYRALNGKDLNYWAFCFSLLALFLGMAGFMWFPK
jgi:hypothetical protein